MLKHILCTTSLSRTAPTQLSFLIPKNLLSATLFCCIALAVSACGGGGSSSGGDQAVQPVVYTGTYTTAIYSGNLTVTIRSRADNTIQISGIPCITASLTEGITSISGTTTGSQVNVGGVIQGNTPGPTNATPVIDITFPFDGGAGEIAVDAGNNCTSVVGVVNLTRS